jgi:hypothetical protein
MPLDAADRAQMVRDLAGLPSEPRPAGEPAVHVDRALATLDGAPWQRYRAAIDTIADEVMTSLGVRWTRRRRYTAALTYRGLGDYPRTVGHAHTAATLVLAMPLSLPPALADRSEGGTVLRNPVPAHTAWAGIAATVSPPAKEGEVLVFPGAVEHRPALPPPGTDLGAGRILVTSDVVYS